MGKSILKNSNFDDFWAEAHIFVPIMVNFGTWKAGADLGFNQSCKKVCKTLPSDAPL